VARCSDYGDVWLDKLSDCRLIYMRTDAWYSCRYAKTFAIAPSVRVVTRLRAGCFGVRTPLCGGHFPVSPERHSGPRAHQHPGQ